MPQSALVQCGYHVDDVRRCMDESRFGDLEEPVIRSRLGDPPVSVKVVLVDSKSGEEYRVSGPTWHLTCPDDDFKSNYVRIIKGFRTDSDDFESVCIKLHTDRFGSVVDIDSLTT